ncbi:MAG: triosephosphate isomerase [Patescibacteria group bacterium]|jgi:triosephosphate isomerase|nr:triosephosphate isomerase [Patescibacteria group bacterium]
MTKKTYIVGNWKMYCSPSEASLLVNRLKKEVGRVPADVEVVLCPPAVDLTTVRQELSEHDKFSLGVQNAYPMDEGAFTGEVSVAMVADLVHFVLCGHSERRHTFHERDGLIAQKVAATRRHGLTPILCVGETRHERESGHAKQVVADQLETGLSLLTPEEMGDVIIAYEPVWAIGSGESAKPGDAREMFEYIRKSLGALHGSALANAVPLLYGGSVNASNAASYLKLQDCQGLLVGGASTNYKSFASIIEKAAA